MSSIFSAKVFSCALVAFIAVGFATQSRGQGTLRADDKVFRDLISQRLEAHSRGDAKGYRLLLADDFIHVDDSGIRRSADQLTIYNSHDNKTRWEIGELHSRLLGNLAIVDCDESEINTLGSRELRSPYHETDIFVFQNKRWLFLQHAETRSVSLPTPRTVDSSNLDDYVGRYDWWPGYSEIFTRKGTTLFQQGSGDTLSTPLRQVTNESFSILGDPSLIIFVRDSRGRVISEVVHDAGGQVFVAQKVRPID